MHQRSWPSWCWPTYQICKNLSVGQRQLEYQWHKILVSAGSINDISRGYPLCGIYPMANIKTQYHHLMAHNSQEHWTCDTGWQTSLSVGQQWVLMEKHVGKKVDVLYANKASSIWLWIEEQSDCQWQMLSAIYCMSKLSHVGDNFELSNNCDMLQESKNLDAQYMT